MLSFDRADRVAICGYPLVSINSPSPRRGSFVVFGRGLGPSPLTDPVTWISLGHFSFSSRVNERDFFFRGLCSSCQLGIGWLGAWIWVSWHQLIHYCKSLTMDSTNDLMMVEDGWMQETAVQSAMALNLLRYPYQYQHLKVLGLISAVGWHRGRACYTLAAGVPT